VARIAGHAQGYDVGPTQSVEAKTATSGDVREVVPGVWRTDQELAPGILLALHLLSDGRRGVLIDTGVAGSLPMLEALIEAAGIMPEDVALVINTHAHHDHIGSNRRALELTGALLAAPAGAVPWIEDHARHLREFTSHHPDLLTPDEAELAELAATLDGATKVDLTIGERFHIRLGEDLELRTLELPGHVDAEIGFYEPASRTLVIADAVPRIDWGLFHGHGRPAVLRATLRRLRALVAGEGVERACLAHYDVMTAAELLDAIAAVEVFVDEVDETIRRTVREAPADGIALGEVWEAVCFAFEREREFRGLAMVAAHLDELLDSAVVERIGPDRYRWLAD
jgi:glyoxylase-like metal-dependent hydrolase (beta-lactamase superfamily II)